VARRSSHRSGTRRGSPVHKRSRSHGKRRPSAAPVQATTRASSSSWRRLRGRPNSSFPVHTATLPRGGHRQPCHLSRSSLQGCDSALGGLLHELSGIEPELR
jgi:hypothetical protein